MNQWEGTITSSSLSKIQTFLGLSNSIDDRNVWQQFIVHTSSSHFDHYPLLILLHSVSRKSFTTNLRLITGALGAPWSLIQRSPFGVSYRICAIKKGVIDFLILPVSFVMILFECFRSLILLHCQMVLRRAPSTICPIYFLSRYCLWW